MRIAVRLLGAFLFVSLLSPLLFAAEPQDLSGLWRAKKRFGPDAAGPLVIERSGSGYTADMMGRLLPVRVEGGELAFDLPADGGAFRGKLENGAILGHWIRPRTDVNAHAASPVLLAADGVGRWRGMVSPLQDAYTLFLLLTKRDDGAFDAVLRNPERDFGTQLGVARLAREGDGLRLIGRRGGKEQDVARGAYDSENEVLTLSIPSRGGSYDFTRDGDDSDFYPRGKNPVRYSYRPPPARDDGWPVASLDEADISRAAMEAFVQRIVTTPMASSDAPQQHGILLARHGKLVMEEYFHGEYRDKLHESRSAGKSVSAIVIGAAMQAGAPLALSTPVYATMKATMKATMNGQPEPDAQKQTMTLENLLTMSGGFFCDDTDSAAPGNEDGMEEQSEEPDWYRYTMRVPLATPPGQNSVYCSAMPHLALGMLGRVTGESPLYAFDRLVARPLKIQRYSWYLDPLARPYGGGGVQLLPRDFLKLGQLMLNGGTWDGRRILGREFVERASGHLYHLRNIYYGYLFWGEDFPYKNRTVHTFSARGAGGQTITVVPELDLVIGTFAGNYSSRKGMMAASNDLIARTFLPAVREKGDDPNAPVLENEYVSPYGTSKDGSRVTSTAPPR
jgi:CubicO group peptidase (beta-lactamase class C family)